MNKENIKLVLITTIIVSIISFTISSVIFNSEKDTKKLEENKVNNKSFAIMLQGEDGYVASEESTWPTSGYILNEELTNCVDNSGTKIENVLNYDSGQVSLKSNKNIFCYLYFDKGGPLGQYIIDNSISGLEKTFVGDETNGYDTLYRFSGTSGNTGINNYICLGTTSICESGSEEMYRIIGVEPSTGYVKVIKQTKYGENIPWNSTTGVTWSNNDAYDAMTTWYNSVSFKSMIVSHSWNIGDVGGTSDTYIGTRSTVMSYEDNTTATAYVGMLALSDYYLANRGDQNWESSYSNYTNNWIHLVNNGTNETEWTMSRYSSSYAWRVVSGGGADYAIMSASRAVRPVFYLNSTVNRISGSGTSDDPFIVE